MSLSLFCLKGTRFSSVEESNQEPKPIAKITAQNIITPNNTLPLFVVKSAIGCKKPRTLSGTRLGILCCVLLRLSHHFSDIG